MLSRVDVALVPAEAGAIEADAYVVIDLLRATTTTAVLFAGGLRRLTVVRTPGEALALRRPGQLLFGEVGGLAPPGFDHGNSPVEAAGLDVAGREAVLATTNGTAAICEVAGRGTVYTGSLANLTALQEHVAARHGPVAIVCAGTEGATRFTLEDLAAAGALVRVLAANGVALGDGAALAAACVEQWPGGVEAMVRSAGHAQTLGRLGLGEDISASLRRDSSTAVPVVVEWGEGWAVLEDAAAG